MCKGRILYWKYVYLEIRRKRKSIIKRIYTIIRYLSFACYWMNSRAREWKSYRHYRFDNVQLKISRREDSIVMLMISMRWELRFKKWSHDGNWNYANVYDSSKPSNHLYVISWFLFIDKLFSFLLFWNDNKWKLQKWSRQIIIFECYFYRNRYFVKIVSPEFNSTICGWRRYYQTNYNLSILDFTCYSPTNYSHKECTKYQKSRST